MAGFFVVNVELAIRKDGRWLMIERSSKEPHSPGTLSFPGGTVEHDDATAETLESAGRREVQEEVGVTVAKDLRYVNSASFYSDKGRWAINVVFATSWSDGEPRPQSADEVQAVAWMSLSEVESDPRAKPWTIANLRAAEQVISS